MDTSSRQLRGPGILVVTSTAISLPRQESEMQIASPKFEAKHDLLPSISSPPQGLFDFPARAPAFRQKAPQRASAPRGEAIRRESLLGNHRLFSYLWRFGGPFHFVSGHFNACHLAPQRMHVPLPLASAFRPAPRNSLQVCVMAS